MTKTVSDSLNVIRFFAMIGVINMHTLLAFTERADLLHAKIWLPLEIIVAFSTAAVPLFFILSGFLTFGSTRTVRENILKTWWRILLPLAVFICLNALTEWYAIYFQYESIPQTIIRTASTVMSSDLWFLVVLGLLYLLTPLLQKITFSYARVAALFAITLCVAVLWRLNSYSIGHESLPALLSCLSLYVYGGMCRTKELKKSPVLFSLSTIVLLIVVQVLSAHGNLSSLSLLFAIAWDIVIGLVSWHVLIGRDYPSKLTQLSHWIAPYTLGVYLIHPLLISIRRSVFQFEYDYAGLNIYQYVTINWITIFCGSLFLSILVSTIPYLRAIIGINEVKKERK